MKTSKWYKALTISTLSIPTMVLLVFMYFTGNPGVQALEGAVHISIPSIEENYNFIQDPQGYIEIDFENNKISLTADLIVYNGIEIEGGSIKIETPDILSINEIFYKINENGNLEIIDVRSIIMESVFERSVVIGLNVMLVSIGVGAASIMVLKRMDLLKRYRRLSALLALLLSTLIFLTLSVISNALYLVFLTFTVSFSIYYLEWMIQRRKQGLPLHDQISQRVVLVNE